MNYTMTFPDTWEEYEKLYGFTDDAELYTNGCRLIPSFRVEQWLQHIAERISRLVTLDTVPERKVGKWISVPNKKNRICSVCEGDEPYKFADENVNVFDYCPHCGAKMDGKEQKSYADWELRRE